MAAGMAYGLDQVGAQLIGHVAQFGLVQLAQVGGGVDARQARVAPGVDREGGGHPGIFAPAGAAGKATRPASGKTAALPFTSSPARTSQICTARWVRLVPPAPVLRNRVSGRACRE